jgi:serine/threonine protein kinase
MDAGTLLGSEIAGRYRLLRHIGDGPLGSSFEASDAETTGRGSPDVKLIVKVVRRTLLSDHALSRHLQTAMALSAIRTPHLVPTLDVAYDLSRGLVVIARNFLANDSIATVLAHTGALAPLAALRIVAQACEGVGAAHAAHLVHGNIKPSNVFLDTDDVRRVSVRVCDPALQIGPRAARSIPNGWEHLRFAAPEQASDANETATDLGPRSDVFSLGALLYALMTGAPPHSEATSADALLAALASREAESVRSRASWVSAGIARVVDQAIRRDPARRFSTARELGAALRDLAGGDDTVRLEELAPVDPALCSTELAPGSRVAPVSPKAASLSDREPDPLLGHWLGGRYRVLRALGSGGMGAVYEVESARGDRFAAKVISRDAAGRSDARLVARFIREAHSVTTIDDVHVTRTIELGTDMTLALPFLVMELLNGQDLGALFKARGAIEPTPLLRVFAQAAIGLSAAHKQAIVHRDVKPANIFLHAAPDSDMRKIVVKICDFGLAKALAQAEGDDASHELTGTGGFLGTPMYMSPEHAKNPRGIDARADLWSLCASLYEGLSGHKLWGGVGTTPAELMLAICTRDFPPLADVAPWVSAPIAAIVEKGLAREPADRWPDLDSMLAALTPHLGGSNEVAMEDLVSVDPARLSTRPSRSRPRDVNHGAATQPEGDAHASAARSDEGHPSRTPRGESVSVAETSRSAQGTAPRRTRTLLGLAGAALVAALVVVSGGGRLWNALSVPKPVHVDLAASAAARECAKNADCAKSHGGDPWICGPGGRCTPLASEDCKVLADPSALESDETLWFGTMFPLTGELASFGNECINAVDLARRELLAVSGGLPPNGSVPAAPIGLVACDDSTNAARAAAHLMQDVHAPAVIGFRSSDEVIDLASRFFIPNRALAIATLNHSPLITKVPHPTAGPRLVWRLADSYGQTPEVMSLLIRQVVEPELRAQGGLAAHEKLRAAAILEETATGLGAEDSLLDDLRINDRRALDNHDDFRVFRCSSPSPSPSSPCEQHADALVSFRPHVILCMLKPADRLPFLREVEQRWPANTQFRPRYLESAELDGFAPFFDERPERRHRFYGLTPPYNDASAKLTRRYNATFHTKVEETQIPAPQYDAFYLLAFASFAATGHPRDGVALANAFSRLMPPAEPVEVGPSSLLEVFGHLSRGGSVALNGASALVDLDLATGERRTDFDVLCPGVGPDGHASGSVPSGLRYDHLDHSLRGTRSCP